MTGHRIEWDHSECWHAEDTDGEGVCNPRGQVFCEEEPPDPLTAHCRVICEDDRGLCEEGYAACPGGGRCAAAVQQQELDWCSCLDLGKYAPRGHGPSCPVNTHPFPPHPEQPHCTNGHLLRAAPDCQAELFLNAEGGELLTEDADRKHVDYRDSRITLRWTGDGYEWDYCECGGESGG